MDDRSRALLELGRALQRAGYAFVTVTPETHRRVIARGERLGQGRARDLRGVFGWNVPFDRDALPGELLDLLRAADALSEQGAVLRSRVRFSTLHGRLFAHSSYPTDEPDAVFFGPDTYRFCSLLARWATPATRAVDVGCGTGAGAITIADKAERRVLADISARALRFAEVNAQLAGLEVELVESDVLAGVAGDLDLVIANPPYMRDDRARVYRDGGGAHGEGLAVRIVDQALRRLRRGGVLVLYTGAAIVDGADTFHRAVAPLLRGRGLQVLYEELDPDVFGEELDRPGYTDVERIAAVGLRVTVG
jgi:methylase of polypeptide subunit release factors